MNTIAIDLPKEQERCRKILESLQSIGAPGLFAASLLKISLKKAEQAAAAGDVVAMIAAYQDLKSYKE
jgi:hypothetical protein